MKIELTPEQQAKLEEQRRLIAAELPQLIVNHQRSVDAAKEPTVSGELRRAIHASNIPLTQIAADAGMTPIQLDEFLTGERTLRSDVLDRLANLLGLTLIRQQ